MPRLTAMIGSLILVLCMAALASAQAPTAAEKAADDAAEKAKDRAMQVAHAGANSIAANAAIGMGLSAVGIGIGLGLACFGALNGMARQPEMKGDLQTFTYIIGGLVEGSGIISMVLCFVTVILLK
jgi:F-type H+-transporting ATPase subunit c